MTPTIRRARLAALFLGGAVVVGSAAPADTWADGTVPEFPIPVARPANAPAALSPDALVEQVLARNPSLAEMVAAWRAASARYPQVTSLEDPMVGGTIGPGTIGPDDPGVHFAYRVEVSQKIPYPGKLRLRGQNALAEASAAGHDVEDTRLQLIEAARDGFYEYYLAERALEVNADNLRLLERYRESAASRYEKRLVPREDVVQARVEIAREQDRRLGLVESRQVAVARLNTLLHLPPDNPLPPPPRRLVPPRGLPDPAALRELAVACRPDLKALADRVAAERAALALACKEFYPDFEPFFMYDRFMGNMPENRDLASMLGVRMNLPIYRTRRYATVAEAEARLAQRQAELAKQTDQVNFQVQEAYERARRSEQAVALYEQTVLPAARENVEANESAYETRRMPFLNLVEARRSEVMLLDRYHEAVADSFRRRATLERVVGGPLAEPAAQPEIRRDLPGAR